MGRNSKIMASKSITITVPEVLFQTFEDVVKTGLYGNSIPTCVERLACDGIRMLKKEGVILPKACK
jgi:hypothetical protein